MYHIANSANATNGTPFMTIHMLADDERYPRGLEFVTTHASRLWFHSNTIRRLTQERESTNMIDVHDATIVLDLD